MKKFPTKYAPILNGVLMSLIMCTVMSFVMTWIFTDFNPGFVERWMRAFGYALMIATPTVLVVAPLVRRLVGRMVERV